MKITSVRPITVRYPEPHDHNRPRLLTLVRIETDSGHVGWGEAITMFIGACRATEAVVTEDFAPLVIGQDPLNVLGIHDRLRRHVWWYGPQGIAALALSAVDIALWDLKGRILGQPVWSLLGGKVRDQVVPCACIHFDLDRFEWNLDEFRAYAAEGYRFVKGGWGSRPDNVFGQDRERDVALVSACRGAIGDKIDLVVDALAARTRWDVKTAVQRCRDFAPFRLRWIEEPLPPTDLEGHVALRAQVDQHIGTGEQEWNLEGYRRLLRYGAADIVQMDPARCQGITGTLAIARMLEAENKPYTLHTWSSALCTAAGIAVQAATSNGMTFDHKPRPNPMQHELVEDPWQVVNGAIAVRDTPGLGVTMRESTVERYRI